MLKLIQGPSLRRWRRALVVPKGGQAYQDPPTSGRQHRLWFGIGLGPACVTVLCLFSFFNARHLD